MKDIFRKWLPKKSSTAESAKDDLYIFNTAENIAFVTVLGVSADHLDEIIKITRERIGRNGGKIVYITDDPDFSVFRRNSAPFEYFPSLIDQKLHVSDMPWQPYLREKWGLLLAKWRPRQILAYGTSIDNFLAAAPKTSGPAA